MASALSLDLGAPIQTLNVNQLIDLFPTTSLGNPNPIKYSPNHQMIIASRDQLEISLHKGPKCHEKCLSSIPSTHFNPSIGPF